MSLYAVDVRVGQEMVDDPYSIMSPSNLNTMNSYIVPTQLQLTGTDSYEQLKYRIEADDTSWW